MLAGADHAARWRVSDLEKQLAEAKRALADSQAEAAGAKQQVPGDTPFAHCFKPTGSRYKASFQRPNGARVRAHRTLTDALGATFCSARLCWRVGALMLPGMLSLEGGLLVCSGWAY